MTTIHRSLTEAKTLIASSREAKEMGRWDAERGNPCQSDAYAFADDNSIAGGRFRGDYTYAYVCAKGL
jgi:hypothetical protein